MKKVVAVRPYLYKDKMNYLNGAFDAWVADGGEWCNHWWQPRLIHRLFYDYYFPFHFKQNPSVAKLMFVCAATLNFNTYADYLTHEIIPMFWDTWPQFRPDVERFIEKNKVKTAIFTQSETAEYYKIKYPDLNILFVPEGIETKYYNPGADLEDRNIDVVEFGRPNFRVVPQEIYNLDINHLYSRNGEWIFATNQELYDGLADSKITFTFPRCDTQPEMAKGIETLTQRYWESMLSRIVMVGRCPKELYDLLGYNPVLEVSKDEMSSLVLDIIANPLKYQPLVNKNFQMAKKYAGWASRIQTIKEFLKFNNYNI